MFKVVGLTLLRHLHCPLNHNYLHFLKLEILMKGKVKEHIKLTYLVKVGSAWLNLVDWLCFTSHRQRGNLETAPQFTVPYEGREYRFYTVLIGPNPGSLRCGIVCHYPIYGDRLLIGRSNLLYACAKHPFALLREPLASSGGLAYADSYKNHGCLE